MIDYKELYSKLEMANKKLHELDTDDELVEEGCSPIWLEEIKMIKDCVLPNIRKNN